MARRHQEPIPWTKEDIAEERLRMAAPDLLAALDSLVANYGDKYLNEGSWSQARAALAKAKN